MAPGLTLNDLKEIRDRAPFRPFWIHLSNGESLPVEHPEHLSLQPAPGNELFVVWVGPKWNLVDVSQVVRLSSLDRASDRQR